MIRKIVRKCEIPRIRPRKSLWSNSSSEENLRLVVREEVMEMEDKLNKEIFGC